MIRLNKFYDLVSGYARILLVNEDGSKEYSATKNTQATPSSARPTSPMY